MATFITFVNWTDQGIQTLKESPARVEAFRSLCAKQGVEINGFYSTMGEYDFIAILEAPSAEVAGRVALAVSAGGNVRTRTIQAFETDGFADLVGSIG